MLFGHETSLILRYQYDNMINRIRILFSIDLDDQNQVPYGQNEGLYRKNLLSNIVLSWNIISELQNPSEWYHLNQKIIFYHSRWSKPGPNRSIWSLIEDFIKKSNFLDKKKHYYYFFLMIFFKKFEILIKSSIDLYLDLLGPGFDHLEW